MRELILRMVERSESKSDEHSASQSYYAREKLTFHCGDLEGKDLKINSIVLKQNHSTYKRYLFHLIVSFI